MTETPPPRHAGSQQFAVELMEGFVRDTGVTGDGASRRYLWTDAFAACNLLGLAGSTGEGRFEELALALVDRVHHVLGRHRDDDPRQGWISGADDTEGERHPTRGGLRIGKPLPERRSDETYDPHREWQRDGQYFHYLTKWTHALQRVFEATGDPRFVLWARELAAAAHDGFTVRPRGSDDLRMHWKMSIDLSRPLVPTMGMHDPLDGLVTLLALDESSARRGVRAPDLGRQREQLAAMCRGATWMTDDPLGIGGLLVDAWRLARLDDPNGGGGFELLDHILDAARLSLRSMNRKLFDLPAHQRLAFRELGLALGLKAIDPTVERLGSRSTPGERIGDRIRGSLDELAAERPLADRIVAFWSEPDHRDAETWTGHRDINAVMLATALAPAGFLGA